MNFKAIPGFDPKNDNHVRRALGACQCAALRHLYEEPGLALEPRPEWVALQTLKGVGGKPDRVQEHDGSETHIHIIYDVCI